MFCYIGLILANNVLEACWHLVVVRSPWMSTDKNEIVFCSAIKVYKRVAVNNIQGHINAGEGGPQDNRVAASTPWNYRIQKEKC